MGEEHRGATPAAAPSPAQIRLRGLLRAHQAVTGDLGLNTVLRRIVEEACELVDAQYGALGVVSPERDGLEEFIHVGMDDATVARIGHLPDGKGLLGALIDDPRAIRLRDIRDDLRSVGFPAGHPPMRGFIGVPIRVRGEVFGNLYLTSLTTGDFDAEDEEVVLALASTAGVAIENARLFEEARRRQAWLQASTDLTRQFLTVPADEALRLVAETVAELSDADLVTVALPSPDPEALQVAVAVGLGAERLTEIRIPVEGTVSGAVLAGGRPVVSHDGSHLEDGAASTRLEQLVPIGPEMVLPLAGAEGVRGVLHVGRSPGRRAFGAADVDMVTNFAFHASVALELADGRREAQRMVVFEDRARIARDLHDHVIQQLFASGMTLQAASMRLGEVPGAELIDQVVEDIDGAIRQIRASIFQLRPRTLLGAGLRAGVLSVIADVTPTLGHEPRVRFSGPVDSVSDEDLAVDVAAVVREGLSNVARHARAGHVEVSVGLADGVLRVDVEDDGVGVDEESHRSGLDNLRHRAEARAGCSSVGPGAGERGTRMVWQVPIT